MAFLSEAAVEQALLDQLHELGYSIEREENIGPDGHSPERESHDELVLKKRFEEAVTRLNPGLPMEARQGCRAQGHAARTAIKNRRIHWLLLKLIFSEQRVPNVYSFLEERTL